MNNRYCAVYIASPYTKGDVGINVKISFDYADLLWKLEFLPYPPLYTHFWHILSPKSYDDWMRMDREWILRCDCVLRLPGESAGADAEVMFAEKQGIPVFYDVDSMVEWRDHVFQAGM